MSNYESVTDVQVSYWPEDGEVEPEWESNGRIDEMYVKQGNNTLRIGLQVWGERPSDKDFYEILIPIENTDNWRKFVKSLLDTL